MSKKPNKKDKTSKKMVQKTKKADIEKRWFLQITFFLSKIHRLKVTSK